MKLLTFSTLYPSAVQAQHGLFVEQRLRHLVDFGGTEVLTARVVAPVPWFPLTYSVFGRYAEYAKISRTEHRHGIGIEHPRYPVIPKLGMSVAPLLLSTAVRPTLRRIAESGCDFDLIDAHYFYPDGVAAVMLGRSLGKPVVVTARGSDLNHLARHLVPRRYIRWAARNASAVVTVCASLKDKLVALGVDGGQITVLRNGVDLELFRPLERQRVRAELGISSTLLVSVGRLTKLKGNEITIRALRDLPGVRLLLVGAGEEEAALRSLAQRIGVGHRVKFAGPVSQDRLPCYYSAADILILASSSEGWPNVLLEAIACGTPVVATRVGGTPEIVSSAAAGLLAGERSPAGLAAAIRRLLAHPPDRAATRRFAERFSWDETSRGQIDLFERILNRRRERAHPLPS